MFSIPIRGNDKNQRFEIQLGENLVEFRLNYLENFEQWAIDMSIEGELIAAGAILLPGQLIAQLTAERLGGVLGFLGEPATLENLGLANRLVFDVEDI